MNRLFSRALVVALVFCLTFAGGVYGDGETVASPLAVSSLWDLLGGTWSALSKIWQEEGSSLDPFGRNGSTSDAGSHLDPFGGPSSPTSDYGAGYDPNG
jgi:hypothetical protein